MPLEFQVAQDLVMAFPTPILKIRVPEAAQINPGLRSQILDRERSEPGQVRSNVGGWHSNDDLLDWPGPEVGALKSWIGRAIQRMTEVTAGKQQQGLNVQLDGGAWANVLRDGGYNKIHNHPGCSWSGVYYVSLGERRGDIPGNGQIEFLDPRMGVDFAELPGMPFAGKHVVEPEPGLMLVFPSWLYHYVNPFHGSGERITIAFNVILRIGKGGPATR
ncbi:TIGR02466 family protein [Thalassobaculum sp. OXR-137]|uniref:TIGR02466 family protein n=1 Tax=Thalassobaculum sp. OXR-137 TaxID=3100173 RepID=UPI002AC8B08E|nr:TIGR02466 family protein [Thalassobaculum sp. OXR-137]WPZ33410.1 TIGR02466 family protein [Thalassobaculum sp. OXR-137]